MKSARFWVVPALIAMGLSGCGTVCNLAGGVVAPDNEPRVYGGVLRDIQVMDAFVGGQSSLQLGDDPRLALVIFPLAVVEPLLSFVADTLTLPLTIPLQERRIASGKNNNGSGREVTASDPGPQPCSLEEYYNYRISLEDYRAYRKATEVSRENQKAMERPGIQEPEPGNPSSGEFNSAGPAGEGQGTERKTEKPAP
jgi:hypothetical protein